MPTEADFRLPRTVVPRHYRIRMEPDLEASVFAGSEVVEIDVLEEIDRVVLNALDLEIRCAALVQLASERRIAAEVSYDTATERATLTLEEPAAPGPWELHVEFSGDLSNHLYGFYRSTYVDEEGRDRILATTQFESTHARRAVPSWDEPDLKATFGVTLVVGEGLTAISNQPERARTVLDDGRVEVTFEDTMIMPIYLLTFIVGELEATQPIDVDGTPLRIVHTPGKENLTAFAIEAAIHGLRYFADYYGIPYPGHKLDMIAIPDFAWGAMENLGAITYRESDLLIDPSRATHSEVERVARVVSHELAHMWFGDLVTMRWWDGVWLNEAFATFTEVKCTDHFRPEWNLWLYFGGDRNAAMEIDALSTTRPVEFPVASPAEAEAMFDILTYEKGSAVLRMLEQYLGEDVFREGIRGYLAKHAYGNTVTDDLWDSLESASGEPVGDIMHSWIYQGGFPNVHVSRTADGYLLEQYQFRFLGNAEGSWAMPILYRTSAGHGRALLEDSLKLTAGEGLVVNAGGHGFYRVRYIHELLEEIVGAMDSLVPAERYALVKDVWAGVLSGETAIADFLGMASRLRDDTEPMIWNALLPALNEIRHVASLDDRHTLATFIRDLVSPSAERLGWHPEVGENDRVRQWRGDMLRAFGVMGRDPGAIAEARVVLDRARSEPGEIDADTEAAALAIVATNGSMDDFVDFVDAFRNAETPQTKNRYRRAMTVIPESEAAEAILDMVHDGTIRRQDAASTIALLLGHIDTGVGTWGRLKRRWNEVVASLDPSTMRRMLDFVYFRSEPDVAADIAAWLETHPLRAADRHVAQQLERLDVRVDLRERAARELSPALGNID